MDPFIYICRITNFIGKNKKLEIISKNAFDPRLWGFAARQNDRTRRWRLGGGLRKLTVVRESAGWTVLRVVDTMQLVRLWSSHTRTRRHLLYTHTHEHDIHNMATSSVYNLQLGTCHGNICLSYNLKPFICHSLLIHCWTIVALCFIA